MFLPSELNLIMQLNWPTQRAVDWHPFHLEMIELNEFDAENKDLFMDYAKYITSFSTKGMAFTVMEEKIFACFGIFKLWQGVYEAWLIPSADISQRKFRLHKASKLFFDHAMQKLDMRRLQVTVCSRHRLAVKWAEVCYFSHEGVLRNYGPQGDDYYIMSRI